MTLEVQFLIIGSMIIGGFYLGLALETYRRLSRHVTQVVLIYLLEIAFWLIQAFVLFYILFRVNGGQIRFYNILAVLLGFAAYKALAAPIYQTILEKIIKVVAAIYNFLIQLITILIVKPITFALRLVITLLLFVFKCVFVIINFIFKLIKTPIVWVVRYFYDRLPQRIQEFIYKLIDFYSIIRDKLIKWFNFLIHKRR